MSATQKRLQLLEDNRDKLDMMADALMQFETIDAEQINDIMDGKMPRPPSDWSRTIEVRLLKKVRRKHRVIPSAVRPPSTERKLNLQFLLLRCSILDGPLDYLRCARAGSQSAAHHGDS